MDDDPARQSNQEAVRAYVRGDTSEPMIISAFREIPWEHRLTVVTDLRPELDAIDPARRLILESILLPLEDRSG